MILVDCEFDSKIRDCIGSTFEPFGGVADTVVCVFEYDFGVHCGLEILRGDKSLVGDGDLIMLDEVLSSSGLLIKHCFKGKRAEAEQSLLD
jgi:hypothetical protein